MRSLSGHEFSGLEKPWIVRGAANGGNVRRIEARIPHPRKLRSARPLQKKHQFIAKTQCFWLSPVKNYLRNRELSGTSNEYNDYRPYSQPSNLAKTSPDLTGQRLGSRLLPRMFESVPTLVGSKIQSTARPISGISSSG